MEEAMGLKKILRYTRDYSKPASNRNFILMSYIAMITLAIIFVWDLLIGESAIKLVILGGIVLSLFVVPTLALKFDRIQTGAVIASLGILTVALPGEFFTGEGAYGCTPIWFVFAFMYIGLSIENKRLKYILLSLHAISAITCYAVGHYAVANDIPWLMIRHKNDLVAYLDSGASLIGVGIMTYLTVNYMNRSYLQQFETAEDQKKKIEELNRSQNRFFSSMSHEIRTPINTIIGLNEMTLREENIPDEVVDNSRNINAASRMLLTTINDILDISKIESGKMEIVPVEYDLGEMLSELVSMIWIKAQEKELAFHVDVDHTCPAKLFGDEVRIKQILVNVLNNAVKYTSKGSVTLSIQCRRGEGRKITLIYSVTDTGMGIRKESIPYLFTAFKRVDEEKNRLIEGTGLGLSIVKQFVDLMGGTISVNSVYTKGSTFIIEIPQQVATDDEIGELNLEARHGRGVREHYRQSFEAPNAHILVVDDNDTNLLVATKLLRDTKVQTDTAGSGAEALVKTLHQHYDVILMDHLMPEMDGIECLHAIRDQIGGLNNDTPVVALTANAGSENQAMYTREGFDGYLLKPVSGYQLESELIRLLPSEMIKITGEVELSGDDMKVSRHRRKVPVMISTDSVCDLPRQMLEKNNIAVIPYRVQTDHGWFLDGVEIESEGLLSYMEEGREARTAEPELPSYENFFAEQLVKAQYLIHISLASKVSKGYDNAVDAARNFDNVRVIDSGHLSGGLGLIVLYAAERAKEEIQPDVIVSEVMEMKNRVKTSFLVDSVEYMYRLGRVSKRVHTMADTLMLHPVIVLKNSSMVVGDVLVGTSSYVRKHYIDKLLKNRNQMEPDMLFFIHTGFPLDELEELRNEIAKFGYFDKVIECKASPTIATNAGPGTFGLLMVMKK